MITRTRYPCTRLLRGVQASSLALPKESFILMKALPKETSFLKKVAREAKSCILMKALPSETSFLKKVAREAKSKLLKRRAGTAISCSYLAYIGINASQQFFQIINNI